MKLVFLTIATAKEEWADLAIGLYQKKISYFYSTEYKNLKPKKYSRDSAEFKKKEDSELFLSQILADDFVVLLDERGAALDSIEFSKKFENFLMFQKKRVVFIVGGAFGVNQDLVKRADFKLSLSSMVMNHLVAQVVIMEQVYRAIAIKQNLPYHNI